MKEVIKIFVIMVTLLLVFFMIVGCGEDNPVLVPVKPNLPKVNKAQKGINAYGSLINILKELDNRRAIEESYNNI